MRHGSFAIIPAVLAALVLPGQQAQAATGLRDLAAAKGLYFGVAATVDEWNDATDKSVSGREANMFTPGNEMKWDTTEPNPGQFNFGPADSLVSQATAMNMRVRGHTLVWHNQAPGWVQNLGATDLHTAMVNHINTEVTHFKGKLYSWDVVNEAFNEDGTRRQSFWQQKLGDGYIADAFRTARAVDAGAKLYYNDYNIDGLGAKSDGVYNMVKSFKQQGVPIDGVGFQGHFVLGQIPSSMQQNIQRFVDLGVDVAITELDVRMDLPSTPDKLTTQGSDYAKVANACLAVKGCVGITTWGITDKHSWIPGTFPGQGAALPFDENYQPKPAYNALAQAFGGTGNQPPPPGGCTATYAIAGQWQGGFQGAVTVTAGSSAINGWKVTWTFANGQTITQSWSATVSGAPAVTATNVAYNGSLGAGASTMFGFIGTWNGTNSVPATTCTAS